MPSRWHCVNCYFYVGFEKTSWNSCCLFDNINMTMMTFIIRREKCTRFGKHFKAHCRLLILFLTYRSVCLGPLYEVLWCQLHCRTLIRFMFNPELSRYLLCVPLTGFMAALKTRIQLILLSPINNNYWYCYFSRLCVPPLMYGTAICSTSNVRDSYVFHL